MYAAYKNFERVAEGKSIEEIATMLGTSKQNIVQAKKDEGFYKWKDYLILNPQKQTARGRFNFARLEWFLNNPATSYVASVEITKTIENIRSRFLDM